MKTKIEYAVWIKTADKKETYNNLSRKEWLASMRIIFKCDIEEIKKEIRRNQAAERKDWKGYYNPNNSMTYPYHVPFIIAQYNLFPDRQWYYIQPYGKEATIIHAARKLVTAYGYDPDSFHDDLSFDCPEHSFLDPKWEPNFSDIEIDHILDELSDINYSDLRGTIEDNLNQKAA